MKRAEEALVHELQELNVTMKQEVYMARKLNETGLKKSPDVTVVIAMHSSKIILALYVGWFHDLKRKSHTPPMR